MRSLVLMIAAALFATSESVSAQDAIRLTYVSIPEARLSSWRDADGVLGKRFVERFEKEGAILRPSDLPSEAQAALEEWNAAVRDAIVYEPLGQPASEHRADPRFLLLGPPENPVAVRWVSSAPPADRAAAPLRQRDRSTEQFDLLENLRSGNQTWLYEGNALRWEEVGEFLDLTLQENTALRRLEEPEHPLWMLREAFANDKRRSNLALYLLQRGDPIALGLQLDLAAIYENPVREYWTEILSQELPVSLASAPNGDDLDRTDRASTAAGADLTSADLEVRIEAERHLFARRIQGSSGRVYGRLDRILQSLYAELSDDGILIIDARASADPFVAIIGDGDSTDWWKRIPTAP